MNKYDLDYMINLINHNISYLLEYNVSIKINNIFNIRDNDNNKLKEELLNYYISNILYVYKKANYCQLLNLINKLFKICSNNYNKIVVDESNIIVDDILEKVLNINGRNITLPLNINLLIEYSISSIIKKKYLNDVINLIIIKFAIIYFCLNI